jgi:RNase P protein component
MTELCGQDGWDLVVIARKTASEAEHAELRTSLTRLLRSSGLLDNRKARAF